MAVLTCLPFPLNNELLWTYIFEDSPKLTTSPTNMSKQVTFTPYASEFGYYHGQYSSTYSVIHVKNNIRPYVTSIWLPWWYHSNFSGKVCPTFKSDTVKSEEHILSQLFLRHYQKGNSNRRRWWLIQDFDEHKENKTLMQPLHVQERPYFLRVWNHPLLRGSRRK